MTLQGLGRVGTEIEVEFSVTENLSKLVVSFCALDGTSTSLIGRAIFVGGGAFLYKSLYVRTLG